MVKNLSLGDLELILCDWYEMDCYWLDFDNHKTTLEDGLECIIIDTMALSKFE